MSRRGPVAAAPVEVVRHLARGVATWEVLHAYRHQGLAAAVDALGERGGAGREPDGVFRSWFARRGPRARPPSRPAAQ